MDTILKFTLIASTGLLISGCKKNPVVPEKLGYEVISKRPHDPDAYTQGLQWAGDRLFESTGIKGQSTVRLLDGTTGAVLRKRSLPDDVFGEGLAFHEGELFVLTWKEKTAFVLDPENFRTLRTMTYQGEGWGLTTDGEELIMSDGSSTLSFRSPSDMSIKRSLQVADEGRPVKFLNELEYINGSIFANVYTTNRIARIDSKTGEVTGWLDLSALKVQLPTPNRAEQLNGIAYDAKTGNLLVTGKNWPLMFEIKMKGK